MHYPYIKLLLLSVVITTSFSCIDRDTIIGTGKQDPDRIVGAGGSFQTGVVGSQLPLPISVRVLDAKGKPVRGVRVEFIAIQGNAAFKDTVVASDVDGYSKTYVRLGGKADTVQVHAVVPGLKGSPVIFTMYAVNSGANGISIVSGNNQTATVGKQLSAPLKVKVVDQYENPIKNSLVYFNVLTGKGRFTFPQVPTDDDGEASSYWIMDTIAGQYTAEARIVATQFSFVTFSAKANADPIPVKFERLSKDSLIAVQSQTLINAIDVRVKDKYGNNDSGSVVRFRVIQGDGTVSPTTTISSGSGSAFTSFTAGLLDSINIVEVYNTLGTPSEFFTIFVYKYLQIDSLQSSGGTVTLWWQKNLNPNFANYTLQRCNSSTFDNTTVVAAIVTDPNTTTVTDTTATVGTSPFYRIQVNYTNGFSFYTNIRDVTVQP